MNLANKLTILRIILVPIFVIVGYLAIPAELFGIPLAFVIMDIIFIVAYHYLTLKMDKIIIMIILLHLLLIIQEMMKILQQKYILLKMGNLLRILIKQIILLFIIYYHGTKIIIII